MEVSRNRFTAADTSERLRLLRDWARTEALPVMGAQAMEVDARFKGVRRMGEIFADAARTSPETRIDVAALADRGEAYWRAVVEMTPGDTLPSTGRVFLDVANGELDRARDAIRLAFRFTSKETVSAYYLGELAQRLEVFYPTVAKEVRAGIAKYDKGDYPGALVVFDRVLAAYPCSARAYHERAVTLMKMKRDSQVESAQAAVFRCDPMCRLRARVTTGLQGYRLELAKLFRPKGDPTVDLHTYADIALDLGDPAIASLALWRILSRTRGDDGLLAERLALFLYGLEQLGVAGIKKNFKGDFEKAFAAIDARRRARIEASRMYRVMQKKE